MKVYQLIAKGRYAIAFNGASKISSKEVYVKYPTDEIIENFKKLCTTPMDEHDFGYLSKNQLVISIVTLEVIS